MLGGSFIDLNEKYFNLTLFSRSGTAEPRRTSTRHSSSCTTGPPAPSCSSAASWLALFFVITWIYTISVLLLSALNLVSLTLRTLNHTVLIGMAKVLSCFAQTEPCVISNPSKGGRYVGSKATSKVQGGQSWGGSSGQQLKHSGRARAS